MAEPSEKWEPAKPLNVQGTVQPFPAPEPGTWIEYVEDDTTMGRGLIEVAFLCDGTTWRARLAGSRMFDWNSDSILSIHRGGECLWRRDAS